MANTSIAPPYRVVFFGSSQASATVLQDLLKLSWLKIVAVVSQASKTRTHRSQHQTPVATVAAEHGCTPLTPSLLDATLIAEIADLEPDVGVLFAYGKILPDTLLSVFPKGIVNIHPSLLPRHRGPAPLEATILHGDTRAGTSIMLITSEMDEGPILAQQSFPVAADVEKNDLWHKLVTTSRALLVSSLEDYLEGKITPQPQRVTPDMPATYSRLITKTDGKLDPHNLSAAEADRHIRAYAGWPGSLLQVRRNGKPIDLLILTASILPNINPVSPPRLLCIDHSLQLHLAGGVLIIERAQVPGRGPVTGRDLCNSGRWDLDSAT